MGAFKPPVLAGEKDCYISDHTDIAMGVNSASKNKDDAKFAEGYRQLTDACNACHQAALQTPIVIQDPKEAMFPDQDFRPKQ